MDVVRTKFRLDVAVAVAVGQRVEREVGVERVVLRVVLSTKRDVIVVSVLVSNADEAAAQKTLKMNFHVTKRK